MWKILLQFVMVYLYERKIMAIKKGQTINLQKFKSVPCPNEQLYETNFYIKISLKTN